MRRRPQSRSWLALALATGVMIACRQLVGIHDEPVGHVEPDVGGDAGDAREAGEAGLPACGISFATAACSACVERSCCASATNCAADGACREYEACLAMCTGDAACRSRCTIEHPIGTIASVPALDQCLTEHCESECSLGCGGFTYYVNPDAGASCAKCVAAHTCSSSEACAKNEECQAVNRCKANCRTGDCLAACEQGHDAGSESLAAQSKDMAGACRADCEIGNYWACVGKVAWPAPKGPDVTVTMKIVDATKTQAVAGVTVKLCAKSDPTCMDKIDEATTAGDGLVVLHLHGTAGPNAESKLNGYLDVTGPGLVPLLVFWSFPLSEVDANLGLIPVVSQSIFDGLVDSLDPQADRSLGFVGAVAIDCLANTSPDVVIAASYLGSRAFYTKGGGISRDAKATSTDGFAAFINVPLMKAVDVVATPNALGKPSSSVTVFVRPGTYTIVSLLPTP